MKYSDKLKDPRWQKKRLEIFKRDDFTCQKCSDKKTTLCVHHLKYNGDPWKSNNDDLITLCEHCHDVVEVFKNDCDFDKIKMLKLKDDINDKDYMLFTSHNGICSMTINDGEIKLNYNFGKEITLKKVIDIFTYTQNCGNGNI